MTSQIDICNRALLSIGARSTISSISPSDGSMEANACAILFQPTFESLARAAYWNCLRKQASLSLLQAAKGTPENVQGNSLPLPPQPWLYAYQLPNDSLHLRMIVPVCPVAINGTVPETTVSNQAPTILPNAGQIPFAVAYETDASGSPITVVLTNQPQAQAIYTVNQDNPQIWDSQFQQAIVTSLAAFLVPALSLHLPLTQLCMNAAEKMIAQARAADGNEGVTTQDHTPDWIQARRGAGGYWGSGIYNNNAGYGGLCDMNWPAF